MDLTQLFLSLTPPSFPLPYFLFFTHNIKLTILTIFGAQFTGIEFIHIVVQHHQYPLPESFIILNSKSCELPFLYFPTQGSLCSSSVSMNLAICETPQIGEIIYSLFHLMTSEKHIVLYAYFVTVLGVKV